MSLPQQLRAPVAPPAAAVPADTPHAGLAALSLHSPAPGKSATLGAAAGIDATTAAASGDCLAAPADGSFAPAGRDAAASGPGPAVAPPTSAPDAGPPVPVGDDGAPLSAEVAASPFSPPASERHAALLKLVDHKIKAGLQMRDTRCADFSALAAEAGAPLFGEDSLIVAEQLVAQAASLANQAMMEADHVEKAALIRRAWVVLLAQALPIIQVRLDKGTLLPGKLRKVEEAYYVYLQAMYRVTEQSVPSASSLLRLSRLMGYDTAVRAVCVALILLPRHPWRADERGRVQTFVLATVRLIPKTAGLSDRAASEPQLVDAIERRVTPSVYGADFCASLRALWRSRAVAVVLRSRGSQTAAEEIASELAELNARQRADVAKRGLRHCALPSCGKQEATVLQFRVCGHCQTTRYCCPEHAKLHWRAHKRESEEQTEGEASGGGGAAA